MKKTKHNPPRERKPNFIKLTKLQRNYLSEIRSKQFKEFSEALGLVYEELGIVEKILKAPIRTYVLRKDLSGLDVLLAPKKEKKKSKEEKK